MAKSKRKKYLVRLGLGILSAALLAILCRNLIVKLAVERIGGYVLGNRVTLARASIGWKQIEFIDLRVLETQMSHQPQLAIAQIRVVPALLSGVRHGNWLRYLSVEQPVLHLRFNSEGQLQSRLPQFSGRPRSRSDRLWQLPQLLLTVNDAALELHQPNKETVRVAGVDLWAEISENVDLKIQIKDLLRSQAQLHCQVDSVTLAGQTSISLAPLHLNTQELSEMALVPAAVSNAQLQATLGGRLRIVHPGRDAELRKHDVSLQAELLDVVNLNLTSQPGIRDSIQHAPLRLVDQIVLSAANLDEQMICTLRGKVAGGDIRLHLQHDLSDATPRCQAKLNIEGVQLAEIARCFLPEVSLQSLASVHGNCIATWSNRRLEFNSSLEQKLEETVVDGLPIPLITTSGTCTGALPEFDIARLEGLLQLHSTSAVLDLANLGEHFGIPQLNGQVSVQGSLHVPLATATDICTLEAVASINAKGMELASERFEDFELAASLSGGAIRIPTRKIRWRDSQLTIGGQGTIGSGPDLSFEKANVALQFDAHPIPLSDVADVLNRFTSKPLRLAGSARAQGTVAVSLPTGQFSAGGDIHLREAQLGSARLGEAQLDWTADASAFHLKSQSASFLGGNYSAVASMKSLDWTHTRIEAQFRGIQLKRLSDMAQVPLTLAGSLDGQLQIDSIRDLNSLNASAHLVSRNAAIGGLPLRIQTREASVRDGRVRLAGALMALDGETTFAAQGSLRKIFSWLQDPGREIHVVPLTGSIEARKLSIQKALDLVDKRRDLHSLTGQADVRIVRDEHAVENRVVAVADGTLGNLRWKQTTLSDRIRAKIVLRPTKMELRNLEGHFAGGKVEGRAELKLGKNVTGTFDVGAEHVSLRKASTLIPTLSRSLSGTGTLSATGQIGGLSKANLKLQASNVHLGELEIREVRLPIACSYHLRAKRAEMHCRGGAIHAGGGIVFVDSKATVANGLTTMNTQIDIRSVDSTKLLRGKSLSAGIIDGSAALRMTHGNAVEDLTGTYHIELSQIQRLQLPGFDQLAQLVKLPTFSGPSLAKDDLGILDGRIGGGMVYLEQATLSKNGLLVLMEGTSTLHGRLDLNVTAVTNPSGPADGLLDLAGSPIMLAAPAPMALLARANDALKDRIVYVHVGGIASRPTLRIQPGKGLSQDALRFVLSAALGSQASQIALSPPNQVKR